MRSALLTIVLAVLGQQPAPDPFVAQRDRVAARNTLSPNFTIATEGNRRRFRIGERIPLVFTYDYVRNRGLLRGSGYTRFATAVLDHADGTADPGWDYERSVLYIPGGVCGCVEGGLVGTPGYSYLDAYGNLVYVPPTQPPPPPPVQLHVLLNDGVRFDAPGRYRLYMEDRHDGGGIAQFSLDAADRRPIVSNIIELEILPRDERLDDEAVTAALRILDTSTDERARVDAAITLRIVSSPRAIDEMAHRLSRRPARGGDDGGFELGLFAARDRTRAIARMEAELDDPDRRMPLSYERALAALRATTGNPDGWLTQAQKREALVTVDRRRLRALQKAGTLVASLAAAFETASNSSVSVRPQGNLVALTPALAEFAAEASAAMSRVPRSKRDWAVQQHAFVFQDVRFVPMLERLARSGSVTAAQLLCEARGCTSAADESTSGVVERQADEEPVIRFFAEEWRPDPYSLDLYGLTLRQLDRRIARFPPGTSFHWDADELYSAWDADVEGAFRRVQALVARHGMTLHRRTPSR